MNLLKLYKQYQFVFTELVKRDFKKKYKRSFLGVLWSMLAPLFTLLVMNFVFSYFFGRTQEYYTIYLFSGWLIFQYYSEATNGAMNSLMANAGIFSKVKVPKYLFLFQQHQLLSGADCLLHFCNCLWAAHHMEVYHTTVSHCLYVHFDFGSWADFIGTVCVFPRCAISL